MQNHGSISTTKPLEASPDVSEHKMGIKGGLSGPQKSKEASGNTEILPRSTETKHKSSINNKTTPRTSNQYGYF
ncbi:hypothetical protein FCV25MIE_16296 [Fagus crenata]